MAPSDLPSITTTKTAFLTSQTRLLSAPLQLSSQYRSSLYSSDSPLSSKAVSDITSKVNEKIRAHNRLVFSSQSIRHVAEQIETLYWREVGDQNDEDEAENGYVAVERDVDLHETIAVAALPETLEDAMLDEGQVVGEDAERYVDLRLQLVALAKKRDEARERLERYRRLKELLKPYEDPQQHIQPNLVTKDGEMSKELDRMRVLLARVGARMGEYNGPRQRTEERGIRGFDQRLNEVMELG